MIDVSLKTLSLNILLLGSDKYKDTVNKEKLVHAIDFLKTTKLFGRPLISLYDHPFNFSSSFTFVL